MFKNKLFVTVLLTFTLFVSSYAFGGGPGGGFSGRGQTGNNGFGGRNGGQGVNIPVAPPVDPITTVKNTAGFSDDEFAAIQPSIQKVLDDLAVVQSGQGTLFSNIGRGGRGRGGNPNNQLVQNDVQKAFADLQDTLQQTDATSDTIETKLNTFRNALIKAKEQLVKDRNDLRTFLTQKQEAQLTVLGVLD